MTSLLNIISKGWGWKLGTPVAVIATNRFGNAIVQNDANQYFRIMPEEWGCELIAKSAIELADLRENEDFILDWDMAVLVERAEAFLGALEKDEVYYLVVPGILGGKYSEENIRKLSFTNLLAYSGDMAQQIDDVADGESVIIKPTE